MRLSFFGLAALLVACASAGPDEARESIEVVYAESMRYEIEDGGSARLVGGSAHPVYTFQASHEEFRRIADLLEPLKAAGLTCSAPSAYSQPGYIVWRRGGAEVRRVDMYTLCYSDGARPLARHTESAWRIMEELGHAHFALPSLPEPTVITLQNMYWGNPTATWTIPNDGEGRYVSEDRTVTFPVSGETFHRVREIFRPYEARDFHCNRVISDGPYGFVIWASQEGREDQRTMWDAGCLTGDAGDLFMRIDSAMEILAPLRDAAAQTLEPGASPG